MLCGVVLLVPQDVPLVFLLPRAVFISSLSTLFAPVAPNIDAAVGVHDAIYSHVQLKFNARGSVIFPLSFPSSLPHVIQRPSKSHILVIESSTCETHDSCDYSYMRESDVYVTIASTTDTETTAATR